MLGKLEKMGIKTVWDEERKFSDWLGEDDGLELLGKAMDMELEPEGREVQVGPYFADLVCRDTSDGKRVVIENQYGKGDHGHLGQLLTYASGLENTKAVVWIAETFGKEHRAVLNWLNERTDDRTRFFGFEIAVMSIGNSTPAPLLNPIARPDEWVRDVAAIRQETKTGRLYREYWTELKEHLKVNDSIQMTQNPRGASWISFPIGKRFCSVYTAISLRKRYTRLELNIPGSAGVDGHGMVDHIREHYEEKLQAELGSDVIYEHAKGRTARIYIQKENVNIEDRDVWDEQLAWFKSTLELFFKVFHPIVEGIDPNEFPHNAGREDEDDSDEEHASP